MTVIVADSIIEVQGWEPRFDFLCTYKRRVRKTPEEVREERERKKRRFPGTKININMMKFEEVREIVYRGNSVFFGVGLWPRIKDHFDTNNIAYEIVDRRMPEIRPPADYSQLAGIDLRHGQAETLCLIATRDCGIIKCTTAFGKSFLIGCICRMYPTLNILVTTRSAQVVGTLYSYLSKLIPGEVGYIYGRGNTAHGKRVIVTTLKSVGHVPPTEVQLLLCDECHEVGLGEASRDLSRFAFCRRFGFTASPIRNDGTFMSMEALFGPVIQEVSYAEAVEHGMVTPLKTAWLRCARAPKFVTSNKELPDFIMKRWSYWSNSYRNTAIANFVRQLMEVYDGQILIMVETLEHAIHLNMALPHFLVAHYGATDTESLEKKFPKEKYPNINLSKYRLKPRELDRMRCAFEKGTLKHVIATMTWKQGVDFKQLTVLIRADGVSSEVLGIQIPGRAARLYDGKEAAFIIDCNDTFSGWALRRTEKRRSQYQKQRWEEVTIQEVLNDLRRASNGGAAPAIEGEHAEALSGETDSGDPNNSGAQ